MKKYNVMELTNEFIENAVIQGETANSGDYKKGNKASEKLFKLEAIMKENTDIAKEMLNVLLEHENINVKIWAGANALDLKYREKEAEQLLTKISMMHDIGILRFNAERMLETKGKKDRV